MKRTLLVASVFALATGVSYADDSRCGCSKPTNAKPVPTTKPTTPKRSACAPAAPCTPADKVAQAPCEAPAKDAQKECAKEAHA